jgi:hypothetical protein
MSWEGIAVWVVRACGAYFALGLAFALFFVVRGVERLDPAARGSSLGFRCILLPASLALWPLLAARWLAGARRPPCERTAHREAAAREDAP